MKKIVSLLLVLMMVLSLSVAASAVQTTTNGANRTDGTITIEDANQNYEYALYKLLHLETYNEKNDAYLYTIEAKWENFFNQDSIKDKYVTIDANGYVSWVTNADVVQFAKDALAYADVNKIDPEATQEDSNFTFDEDGTGGVFSGLSLGYYLVDTSMGALCGLDTANPNGTIRPKNGVPTLDKTVQEDSKVADENEGYGEDNTADIGQAVNFEVTIDAKAGAENYVFHDQLPEGMDFNAASLKVFCGTDELTKGDDYTLVTNSADCDLENWDCSFEVVFDEEFLKDLENDDTIYIRYSATLNEKAVIGEDGNENSAQLEYGDGHKTTIDKTTTYTYGFDIFKTDPENNPLQGAEFQLLDENKNMILLAYNTETKQYRMATALAENEERQNTIVVSDVSGIVRIVGLDNGTYYLRETKAPDGYKLLPTDKQILIDGENLFVEEKDGAIDSSASVQVVNNRGLSLPETGGLGTLLFTVLGGTTAMGTGVVMVTKKRMSKIKDED